WRRPKLVRSLGREGSAGTSSCCPGLLSVKHSLKALKLSPPAIHSEQHLSPILRFSSSCPGMDSHDRVPRIIFTGKQAFGFQPIYELPQSVDFATQFTVDVLPFTGQFKVSGNVVAAPDEIGFRSQHI